MSLQEARAVIWLRNYPKPLGDLLDQGYLDKHRLTWAAQKANDPRLRMAAGVLLEWLTMTSEATPRPSMPLTPPSTSRIPGGSSQPTSLPVVDAGITLEQARAVAWPFKPFRGQRMGELVDTQQLNLRDLVYAIENAWDERVRRAATALVSVRLNQVVKEPPPPAGPLQVVSLGRSYSEARQFRWMAIYGMLLGALTTLGVLLALWTIRGFVSRPILQNTHRVASSPAGIIALLVVLVLTAGVVWLVNWLLNLIFNSMEQRIANYRKGQEGEEQVVELVRQNLDGTWTLFRNVVLPGRSKGDIDAVLVGAPGIWALEIKALKGEYRNIGEHWEVHVGKSWRLLKKSPSRQAQDNAARLSRFLKADGITQWVTPAVIWANRESPLSVENPMTAVWTVDRLPEEVGNLWQGRDMGEADRGRTLEKLRTLCQGNGEAGRDAV